MVWIWKYLHCNDLKIISNNYQKISIFFTLSWNYLQITFSNHLQRTKRSGKNEPYLEGFKDRKDWWGSISCMTIHDEYNVSRNVTGTTTRTDVSTVQPNKLILIQGRPHFPKFQENKRWCLYSSTQQTKINTRKTTFCKIARKQNVIKP